MTVFQTASPTKSLLQLTVQFAFGRKTGRKRQRDRDRKGRERKGGENKNKRMGFLAAQLYRERYARNAVRGCTYTGPECQ